jgi:NAD(P)-dependent dehydrogenase (short-subunit alcohol dehydrogenase family)
LKDVHNKTAVVTGGAAGIGLEIGRSLGRRGARVMLLDIDETRLRLAADSLAQEGIDTAWQVCDVSDANAVRKAADETIARFGKVHILVNNAGVSLGGKPGKVPLEDWRWIVDINLMGVVHGVEVFLPLMLAHGEGGYIVNTSSMAGHLAAPLLAPYNATKFAVVGYSETLAQDLAAQNIGVSVLCPGWVKTNIHNTFMARPSARHRKADINGGRLESAAAAVESGIDPHDVGEWVADCIRDRRFYVFTHPEMARFIDIRHALVKSDYAACAAQPRFNRSKGKGRPE